MVLVAKSGKCGCVIPTNLPKLDLWTGLRKSGLPSDHMVLFFQKRDGLTILDRMGAYCWLIALHEGFEAFAEFNFSAAKEIGQLLAGRRLRHGFSAECHPSAS